MLVDFALLLLLVQKVNRRISAQQRTKRSTQWRWRENSIMHSIFAVTWCCTAHERTSTRASTRFFVLFCVVCLCFVVLHCGEGGELATQRPTMTSRKVSIVYYSPCRHSQLLNRTNPGTEAEPQQIVAQRLLSCLQYPVP